MKNFNKYPPKDKQPKIQKLKINLFGYHAVHEAWLNPDRKIKEVYVTDKAIENFEPYITKAKALGLNRPDYQVVERRQMDKTLGENTVHQGIGIFAEPLPEMNVMDLIIKASHKDTSLFVMLDHVTDPHNVGAIMRSACVFGLDGLVMQTRFAPPLEGVLPKVACGAVEHVCVALETNLSRALELFKDNGYTCIALDEHAQKSIGALGQLKKAVLVMGAEGKGLRPSIKDTCNETVKLPVTGEIQSLNVSNAAAISFYALGAG